MMERLSLLLLLLHGTALGQETWLIHNVTVNKRTTSGLPVRCEIRFQNDATYLSRSTNWDAYTLSVPEGHYNMDTQGSLRVRYNDSTELSGSFFSQWINGQRYGLPGGRIEVREDTEVTFEFDFAVVRGRAVDQYGAPVPHPSTSVRGNLRIVDFSVRWGSTSVTGEAGYSYYNNWFTEGLNGEFIALLPKKNGSLVLSGGNFYNDTEVAVDITEDEVDLGDIVVLGASFLPPPPVTPQPETPAPVLPQVTPQPETPAPVLSQVTPAPWDGGCERVRGEGGKYETVQLLRYERNTRRCWVVVCPGMGRLLFTQFDTEEEYDTLQVGHKVYSGTAVPSPRVFDREISLSFKSDGNTQGAGFEAVFLC